MQANQVNIESSGEELRELIYKDELTKVFNRRYLNKRFGEISDSAREKKEPLSFLMIDVDYFKGFNDKYGHDTGDEVLMQTAQSIAQTVGSDGISIRYAGDEFVVLLPGQSKDKALEIAEKIRTSVEEKKIKIKDEDEEISVTLSIGLSNYPVDTNDPVGLQSVADKTAYISKKLGRNRVSTIENDFPETLEYSTLHRYFPCRKLIGRDELLEEVKQYLNPAPTDSRPMVIFSGLPGTGKTRLIEELYSVCDKNRAFIIKTQASSFTIGQPFVEVLSPIARILEEYPEITSKAVSKLDPTKIHLLLPFLPILSRFTITSIAQSQIKDPALRKEALLDGLKEIIFTITEIKPLFIFIDEFHFLNLGTGMLLSNLKSDTRGSQIAIFGAICDVDMVKLKDADIIEFIQKHEAKGDLLKKTITSLDREKTSEMADNIIRGLAKHGKFIDLIFKNTDGNSGKIEALLKKLIFQKYITVENGELKVEEFKDEEFEQEADFTVDTVYISKDQDIYNLLSKASVIGPQFNMDILKKLDARSDSMLYEILDKAEKADIISKETKDEEEVYLFRNEEVKTDLYDKIDEPNKKDLHKQVGQAEKELSGDEPSQVLSKLAYHFEKAGDHIQALDYLSKISKDFGGLFSAPMLEVYLGKLPELEDWGEEKELTPEQEKKALRMCKRFRLATNNLGRYPETSEIAKGAIDASYNAIRALLDEVDVVSVADAEGIILINNNRPSIEDSDDFDENDFLEIIQNADLKGFSLRKGFTRAEFVSFIKTLLYSTADAVEKAGGWPGYLKAQGITNVQVNQRVFVTLSQKDILHAQIGKKKQFSTGKKPSEAPSAVSASAAAAIPEELERQIKIVKDKYSNDKNLINFMDKVQETLKMLSLKEADIKRLEKLVQDAITNKDGINQGLKALQEAGSLAGVIDTENASDAPVFAQAQLAQGQADSQGMATKQEIQYVKALHSAVQSQNLILMDKIKEDTDVLIHQLNYPDIEVVRLAGSALKAKGASVIQPLFNYAINSDNILGRKTAVTILKDLDQQIGKKFLEAIIGNTSALQKESILVILKDFPGIPLDDVARMIIRDSDAKVRRTFLAIFEKQSTPSKINLLLECLNEEDEDIVCDVIYSLGRLKAHEAAPYLVRIIEKKLLFLRDGRFQSQEAACKVLGQLGGENALRALSDVIKYSVVSYKRNKPPVIRAAATFALGYYSIAQAGKFFDIADRDSSPVVRSAAKLARAMASESYTKP